MKTKNTLVYEFENLKMNKPLLSFEGDMSFGEWKEKAKKKLTELLCLPLERGDGGHLNYADLIWEKLYDMDI